MSDPEPESPEAEPLGPIEPGPPARVRWWEDPTRVKHRLAGVFEGGGAKGVAYAGALRATLEKECWFGAVAGASAGAITAALIASGLDVDELDQQSRMAFERFRAPSVFKGLRQLRYNFGYFDNESVGTWLEETLSSQVQKYGVHVPGPVTFATLYHATGIELNVVAADLSRGRQIVFSAWDTPSVQVADAVLASSSIPFAFAPRQLLQKDGATAYVHTIVDGGVWSNFPQFVFTDPSFRRASGRSEQLAEEYVVGYLLDEQGETDIDLQASRFVPLRDDLSAFEWRQTSNTARAPRSLVNRTMNRFARLLAAPIWVPLRIGAWFTTGGDRSWKGRWREPEGIVGLFIRVIDDCLASLHSLWFVILAGGAVVVGSVAASIWLFSSFLLLRVEEMGFDIAFEYWPAVVSEMIQIVVVVLVIVLIPTVTLLLLGSLAANYLLLGPMRHMLFGVARTYAAGPGAPAWAGAAAGDHVIRLPIPAELTTLSFDRTVPRIASAIERATADAERVTTARLSGILATPPQNGPQRPSIQPAAVEVVPAGTRIEAGERWVALRVTIVALTLTSLLVATTLVLPSPKWFQYDVNIRICAKLMHEPVDPCDEATPDATAISILFGPGAAGQVTQAVVSVDGTTIERSDALPNPGVGRIVGLAVDWDGLCEEHACELAVDALVNGEVVFQRTIRRQLNIDWE